MTIQPKQEGIAGIAQFCDPFKPGSHRIENIAMDYKVFLSKTFQLEGPSYGEIPQVKREYLIQEIIMVAPEVYYSCVCGAKPFHEQAEESRVLFLPFARFTQLPSVYDIPVEDQGLAGMPAEEVYGFPDMGIPDAEVDV
jgi:hypothetical protein